MEIIKQYDELLTEYMTDYMNEILVHRSVPETRDGLSEVQRRILYTIYEKHWLSSKPYVKCAKINGQTMTYHYHGTASIYGALINMSQDFKNQIPMIDTNGNNGTIYGDQEAADRYLEARLSRDAELIYFDEFSDTTVDFIDNFDLSEKEPLVLPARLPMYLINGCYGIASGYSVSVPPHNPVEVIDETIKLLDNPSYEIYLRPDLPNGCSICTDDKKLEEGYSTGRGSFTMKGKFIRNEKDHSITITEIPYLTTLDKIKSQIKQLVAPPKKGNKKVEPAITFIKSLSDSSDSGKINLKINIKRDYTLEYAEAQLYSMTRMKLTLPFSVIGTFDRKFKIYNSVQETLEEWINSRISVIKRKKLGFIKKYNYRLHLIDGLLTILDNDAMDEVIEMIRNSNSDKEIIDNLMNNYKLSDPQANYIADMKLRKLSNTSLVKLRDEKQELTDKTNNEIGYLKNEGLIKELIKEDLLFFRNRYSKIKRKTNLVLSDEFNSNKKVLIEDSDHTLVITHQGYVKKLSPINSQKRNGKGSSIGKLKENDYPVIVEEVSNKDNLCIFTNTGKVYKFPIWEFNDNTTNSYGNYIGTNINNEKITSAVITKDEYKEKHYGLVIATKLNKIKITELNEFSNISRSGIIATKLSDTDEVISVNIIDLDVMHPRDIVVTSSDGVSLYMDSNDISVIKRTTYGVSAMSKKLLERNAYVASVTARYYDSDEFLFILTKKGIGKLVNINEYSKLKRGAMGVKSITLKDDDEVAYAGFCNKEQEISIISNKMIVKIPVSEVSEYKRPAAGVRVKNLDTDEEIIDVSIM